MMTSNVLVQHEPYIQLFLEVKKTYMANDSDQTRKHCTEI
jgi:hypothetical protein